jgi:hypothetical protein
LPIPRISGDFGAKIALLDDFGNGKSCSTSLDDERLRLVLDGDESEPLDEAA